ESVEHERVVGIRAVSDANLHLSGCSWSFECLGVDFGGCLLDDWCWPGAPASLWVGLAHWRIRTGGDVPPTGEPVCPPHPSKRPRTPDGASIIRRRWDRRQHRAAARV